MNKETNEDIENQQISPEDVERAKKKGRFWGDPVIEIE